MTQEGFDPVRILAGLRAHGVRAVVVGGFAAQVHGVGTDTDDVDVCIDLSEDNLDRLTLALEQLGARPVAADRPGREGHDARESFETVGGRLDCVELPPDRYVTLERDADLIDLGLGVRVHVAPPERLADLSRDAGDLGASVRLAALASPSPRAAPSTTRAPSDEGDELARDDEDVTGSGARVWKALAGVDRYLTDLLYR